MVDPLIGAPIVARAAIPLASLLGRAISGDEKKLICRSFEKAMRRVREEGGLAGSATPEKRRLRGKVAAAAKRTRKAAQRVGTPTGWHERASDKAVAHWLAETWAAVSSKKAASRQGDGDQINSRRDWFPALVDFLATVAREGVASVEPTKQADHADNGEARKAAHEMWIDVLGKEGQKDVRKWALQVAARVKTSWRETKGLHGLLAQLNHDSSQGSIEAIAFAAQDVAQSLSRLVTVTVPATLVGGGGIVLLVLFVDKG